MEILKKILIFLIIGFGNSLTLHARTNITKIPAPTTIPITITPPTTTDIEHQILLLQNQLQSLELRLASAEHTIEKPIPDPIIKASDPPQNKREIKEVKKGRAIANASGNPPFDCEPLVWQGPDISFLFAGGASAGYSKPDGSSGAFNILDFNPLFLFTYKDLFFLRSSIDFSLDDFGDTSVSLDQLNLNFIVNDYIVFGAGKFDSSLGYFVPNLSPAWINRLADTPVGFDGDEAAPQAQVGMQVYGAVPLFCTMRVNYVFFVANGSEGFVDTDNEVIDHIGTDGYVNNFGNFMYGGRLGFLPIPKLEIGFSAAAGKIVLINLDDGITVLQRGRDYYVFGGDFSYKWKDWDFRAEYIQQQVRSQSNTVVPQGEKWKAWYAQVAYWIPGTKLEPVLRYSKFTAPVSNQEIRQWAFGIDYWFTPSIAVQAEYEFNKGQSGTPNNRNLFLFQLVFGY